MLRLALAIVMAASLCTLARGGFLVYFDDLAELQPDKGEQVVHAFLKAETGGEPAFNGAFLSGKLSGPTGVEFSSAGVGAIRLKGDGYVWDTFASELSVPREEPNVVGNSIVFKNDANGNPVGVKLGAGQSVKLASFLIDTTNVFSGPITIDFPLDERNYLTPRDGGDPIPFAVQRASLNIVATPEPGTLGCVALCAAISAGIRQRYSRRSRSTAK